MSLIKKKLVNTTEDILKMYNLEYGGEKNHSKAKELYEKSCSKGYMEACYYLGLWYELGDAGINIDYPKAKEFYKKACDNNHKESCDKFDELNRK